MVIPPAKYFGTSPDLWLGLQEDYELDVAMDELVIREKPRRKARFSLNPLLVSRRALHTGPGDVDFEFIPRQGIGVVLADRLVCAFL